MILFVHRRIGLYRETYIMVDSLSASEFTILNKTRILPYLSSTKSDIY